MKKQNKLVLILAGLLSLGIGFTACFNDNDSNSSFVDNGSSTGSSPTGASSEEDKGCASSVVGLPVIFIVSLTSVAYIKKRKDQIQ